MSRPAELRGIELLRAVVALLAELPDGGSEAGRSVRAEQRAFRLPLAKSGPKITRAPSPT
jgi:hypothetical protein